MLNKKQIWAIFLFKFKIGCKTVGTTRNINNAFPQELEMRSDGLSSFAKEMRPLKMRSAVTSHWKLTTTSWEQVKLLKNSVSTVLWLFGIWNKLERWQSSRSGCLVSWLQIKKNHLFEVSSSLILCNNEPFLNRIITCNEKWVSYNNWQWSAQ